MSETAVFRGEGGSLTIEVLRYENSAADNVSDANWLTCRVSVRTPQFHGDVDAAVTTDDFEQFLKELQGALAQTSGAAALKTDEEQVGVSIHVTRKGSARIEGEVKTIGPPKASLTFSFDSDQTYLGKSVADIERIVRAFPSRGSRPEGRAMGSGTPPEQLRPSRRQDA